MFRQVFAIAGNARCGTEALFVVLEGEGLLGLGQASFPPYMLPARAENQAKLMEWSCRGPRELGEWQTCLEQPERVPPTCLPALQAQAQAGRRYGKNPRPDRDDNSPDRATDCSGFQSGLCEARTGHSRYRMPPGPAGFFGGTTPRNSRR